jgi:hypothetical protein
MVASWAEFDRILQVIGCKVCIAYGHGQGWYAAFAELYGRHYVFHCPATRSAVGKAVAIRPGFDGFNVLLRANRLRRF